MECRTGCAACCIAPSIVQPIPNMPDGKPAGVACVNLDLASLRCTIWHNPDYPSFCKAFIAEAEFCGANRDEALQILTFIEHSTSAKQE